VFRSEIRGLCLILDADHLRTDVVTAAEAALRGGVRFFQYRNKSGSRRATYDAALRLGGVLRRSGALFIVNDHTDIAMAVDADGVHLGQDDLPLAQARKLLGAERIIGLSTHSVDQARAAQTAGADYIGYGPVFPTATKDAGPVQGVDTLRQVRAAVTVPIIAIGGITDDTLQEVIRAGADGAAVISAILTASDITAAAGRLSDRFRDREVRAHTR
jgi:thiamine-phosphate pyrophosphorylase